MKKQVLAICGNLLVASLSLIHGLPACCAEELQGLATQTFKSAPPAISETASSISANPRANSALHSAQQLYSIGDPTDEEQLYLELINRARANPAAEATRLRNPSDPDTQGSIDFFKVNLDLMQSQVAQLGAAPPLAFHPLLIAAARAHTQDMFNNEFQGHDSSNGTSTGDRITAAGYTWNRFSENVFSYAKSVEHGHAGFEIDWGPNPATGGMQDPPGHRLNIHNVNMREIGIGVVLASKGSVGPQLVTQDFGSRRGLTPFITGVAYYDLNGNNFYDIGEGMGGIKVNVSGANFFAVTTASGGYAVPVPVDGPYSVTFSGSGMTEAVQAITVTGGTNVKLDLIPSQITPMISGTASPSIGFANQYQFTSVPGATSYQWSLTTIQPSTAVEGAEQGESTVTINTSEGYPVIDRAVKASGAFSLHLAHPVSAEQSVTLKRVFRLNAASQLVFSKRLGWAAASQVAKALLSLDRGRTWVEIWNQVGSGGRGETTFSQQRISLAQFAGQDVQIRFAYVHLGGGFFNQTDAGVGLYLDDISVSSAEELSGETIAEVTGGTAFTFTPPALANYSLAVRARNLNRTLPWGPAKSVTATATPPATPPTIASVRLLSGAELEILIQAIGNGANLQIQAADSLSGTWSPIPSSIEPAQIAGNFRAIIPVTSAAARFFRVAVQ